MPGYTFHENSCWKPASLKRGRLSLDAGLEISHSKRLGYSNFGHRRSLSGQRAFLQVRKHAPDCGGGELATDSSGFVFINVKEHIPINRAWGIKWKSEVSRVNIAPQDTFARKNAGKQVNITFDFYRRCIIVV